MQQTRRGEVLIESVTLATSGEGFDYLDVLVDPATEDPHFRIFNPPTGVLQPDGSIVEDPLMALAEVLAMHGGASTRKRRIP